MSSLSPIWSQKWQRLPCSCVGAIVEGRHVAAAMDPDAFRGPQLLGQVLWQLIVLRGTSALKGTAQLVTVGALPFLHNHALCHDLPTFFPSLQPHLQTPIAPVLIGDFNCVQEPLDTNKSVPACAQPLPCPSSFPPCFLLHGLFPLPPPHSPNFLFPSSGCVSTAHLDRANLL